MKRLICTLMALLLCAASAQADAVLDTVDYDNAAEISTTSQDGLYLYVVLEDGTAGITGYLGDETALVIPSVVDDLPVTAIGAYAFEYAPLTSVVIPECVTVIDCEAFAAASALKAVYGMLQKQATTMAFGDAFALLAVMCAGAAFVTLLAQPVRAQAGAPPSDAH